MKKQTHHIFRITLAATLLELAAAPAAQARAVDLLQRYPTSLTAGLLEPGQARPWQFTPADIFRVSRFSLQVGQQLKVQTGPADLGIGHCADGAVWAVLIPREGGKLTRQGTGEAEDIAHVWLRFHPEAINRLFPPDTVSAAGSSGLAGPMRTIANAKFRASYHAGMNAMIPEPKDMTVDVDAKGGPRRFFVVDTQARTAQYVGAFERQPVRLALGAGGAQAPPKIVAISPRNGATDVDPALKEITVTFDQAMAGGFSWTGGGPQFPGRPAGKRPHWTEDHKTCVLPVELKPGWEYELGLNSPSHQNFRSAAGVPLEPVVYTFKTREK